jgi:hypothetical protein
MRPAHETAAFDCSELTDFKALHSARQGKLPPGAEPPHDGNEARVLTPAHYSVLILDASPNYAASLVYALHAKGIAATAFQSQQDALEFVSRRRIELAIQVLQSKSWRRDELRLFCSSIRYLHENVEIVCILRWPEECSHDRLYGDTLNVTVLHEP